MRFTEGKAYEEDPIIGTYDLPEQQAKRGSAWGRRDWDEGVFTLQIGFQVGRETV